ncbi:cupin domain-containing protein [Streptomyces sparsus]
MVKRNFDSADEVRPFEDHKGRLELIETDHGPVGRAVFEPGWQWSKHVGSIAGTESCQAAHTGYCVSGRMKIVMDDGQEAEYGPGDFMEVDPGHDAWVVGDEACVALDWTGMADYAKRMATA